MYKIITILILFIFIIYLYFNNNNMENMTNSTIEITLLPKCKKHFICAYKSNTQSLNNDNKTIYQDIVNPFIHPITVNTINYNLTKIQLFKSNYLWHGKPVGLMLQLTHINYNPSSTNNFILLIPIDIVDKPIINNIETFTPTNNLDSDKEDSIELFSNTISQYNLNILYNKPYDINKISLNTLFNNIEITQYNGYTITIGKFITLHLCILNPIINSINYVYILEPNIYICDPIPMNIFISNNIFNNLFNNSFINY